jgi:hypothetical protein
MVAFPAVWKKLELDLISGQRCAMALCGGQQCILPGIF